MTHTIHNSQIRYDDCFLIQLVINTALGFDTFLVQRHGIRGLERHGEEVCSTGDKTAKNRASIPGSKLGCYFCNDVVAPGDSTRDRSLDQQCTVTRPGVSMIAGALAVELMVSVIQHPRGLDAPAAVSSSKGDHGENNDDGEGYEDEESCLGIVPHQIRGFLSRFTEVLPSTTAFKSCTACSDIVIEKYKQDGLSFLFNAFNDPNLLEEITGLKKLHEDTNLDDVWALSDDDLDSETSKE
jgi:ubiquitin-like modifier-activating enzyme ATG7